MTVASIHGPEKLQYLLDRLEIQDLQARYAKGQDDHQGDDFRVLEDWDQVFTPDAIVDFSEAGSPFGIFSYKDLAKVMRGDEKAPGVMNASMLKWQHMMGLPIVEIDGDTATCRVDMLATHVGRPGKGTSWHLFDGVTFHDQLVRTAEGWRIKFRRLSVHYLQIFETLPPGKSLEELVGSPANLVPEIPTRQGAK